MRLFHGIFYSYKQVGLAVRKHVFGKGENPFAFGGVSWEAKTGKKSR